MKTKSNMTVKDKQIFIGTDFGYRPNWFIRLLVKLRLKKRTWDYSCSVISEVDEKGIIHIKNVIYF